MLAKLRCSSRAALSVARTRNPTSRRAFSVSPVMAVQEGLASVQLMTGMPWYLTLGGSALALRVALLPSVVFQVRQTRRLMALRPNFAVIRREVSHISSPNERARVLAKRMWAECLRNNVHPLSVVGLPLVQIPLLLGLLISIRRMLLPDSPYATRLESGGASWFKDLTRPDPTAVLPTLSLLILVANLQLSLHGGRPGGLLQGLRNFGQAAAIVALPFYAELPAGVFMYW